MQAVSNLLVGTADVGEHMMRIDDFPRNDFAGETVSMNDVM